MNYVLNARIKVFTAVKIQDEFFWLMTRCSVVVGCQRFRAHHKNTRRHKSEEPDFNILNC